MTGQPKIGLALSGGGSRAIAFHLGCLRALHDLKLLEQVEVISTVSGGSVIGGMFVSNRNSFSEFEARVRTLLAQGFFWPTIVKALTTTEGLRALSCWLVLAPLNVCLAVFLWSRCALFRLLMSARRGNYRLTEFQLPVRRFASRTTILQRVFNEDVFKGQYLTRPAGRSSSAYNNCSRAKNRFSFLFFTRKFGILAYRRTCKARYPPSPRSERVYGLSTLVARP